VCTYNHTSQISSRTLRNEKNSQNKLSNGFPNTAYIQCHDCVFLYVCAKLQCIKVKSGTSVITDISCRDLSNELLSKIYGEILVSKLMLSTPLRFGSGQTVFMVIHISLCMSCCCSNCKKAPHLQHMAAYSCDSSEHGCQRHAVEDCPKHCSLSLVFLLFRIQRRTKQVTRRREAMESALLPLLALCLIIIIAKLVGLLPKKILPLLPTMMTWVSVHLLIYL